MPREIQHEDYDSQMKVISTLLLGAGESVDVLLRMGPRASEWMAMADSRLKLRCILTAIESLGVSTSPYYTREFYDQMCANTTKALETLGWEVRTVRRVPSLNCIIRDSSEVLLANVAEEYKGRRAPYYHIKELPIVSAIKRHFDKLWNGHEGLDLVYEDLLYTSIPEISSSVIVASEQRWQSIINYLAQNPSELYTLDPRRFEELIAELLMRDGMEVELTEASKDGGRDLLAWADTPFGRHLYLVECKRYGVQNPVGVSIVRSLYGVLEAEQATAGLIVTTSSFTKGALEFQRMVLEGT
jgi:hypothetical protein